jgi:hypothetical protein
MHRMIEGIVAIGQNQQQVVGEKIGVLCPSF